MAGILAPWIKVWLVASAVICAIDVSFTMLRPLTIRGGVLEQVYYLWNIYADVDVRYATTNDIVTATTGRLMLVEIVMNVAALVMVRSTLLQIA
ncbi:Protein Y38H6C.16 [Aphelenchoides avenae]|nr:Protein Y38H6C.16 [Aphelenchus avenae]